MRLAQAVGSVVRSRRLKRHLTQEALAELAGVHRTYVGMVERAERNVTIQSLVQIAMGLGCRPSTILMDAEALLGDTPDEVPSP